LFIIYISDFPLRIYSLSEATLFANHTSIIISNRNFGDFSTISNLALSRMIEWFAAAKLILKVDKKKYNEICNA
jgi:hypothetical protein